MPGLWLSRGSTHTPPCNGDVVPDSVQGASHGVPPRARLDHLLPVVVELPLQSGNVHLHMRICIHVHRHRISALDVSPESMCDMLSRVSSQGVQTSRLLLLHSPVTEAALHLSVSNTKA